MTLKATILQYGYDRANFKLNYLNNLLCAFYKYHSIIYQEYVFKISHVM